jgi:hypothetical protein
MIVSKIILPINHSAILSAETTTCRFEAMLSWIVTYNLFHPLGCLPCQCSKQARVSIRWGIFLKLFEFPTRPGCTKNSESFYLENHASC